MRVRGVDNGNDGALVLLVDGALIERIIMPTIPVKKSKHEYDVAEIVRIVFALKPDHAFIEKAQSMPKQGIASAFNYGAGFGCVRGVMAGLGIAYTLVHPRTWQQALFKDLPKSDTKAMSHVVCTRLWPAADWRATPKCRKAHDGLTDAALIAEYGRRVLCGVSLTK